MRLFLYQGRNAFKCLHWPNFFFQISELASMKQPKDSLQLAKLTRIVAKLQTN